MIKRANIKSFKFLNNETGAALIIVLVLLLLGSLTIVPVLAHVGTALKTGGLYEDKTKRLYAADAGVEDAIWQIKYDALEALSGDPDYAYNFSTNCTYELEDPVNGLTTNVTIQNVWIPSNVPPPSDSETARIIIESNKLMVSGTAGADPMDTTYKIKIFFYPGEDEEDELLVDSLGVWLPLGFSYTANTSNLEQLDPWEPCYSKPTVEPYDGGESILWEFSSANLTYFPGVEVDDNPQYTEITFDYTANVTGAKPAAVSWIETSGAVSDILPVTWDIDTRIYKIVSIAEGTQIEAYASRCELRDMNDAYKGDYKAVGNSLMLDLIPDWGGNIRDEKLTESDATINNIPEDGEAIRAFLYWSGWCEDELHDYCNNFSNWDGEDSDDWSVQGLWEKYFRGHHSGDEDDRVLTMDCTPLDLHSYQSVCDVKARWEQWIDGDLDSSDALFFQFSGNGGTDWSDNFTAFEGDIGAGTQNFSITIPTEYLTSSFLMRFHLVGFSDHGEYCYLDDIAVTPLLPDTSVYFKINDTQVYLDGNGDPQTGLEEITAENLGTLENYPGYSYACNTEVTKLVRAYTGNSTGNAKYTVGNVDGDLYNLLSYAGWSIVVIYFSPETAGHHLYLYDDFAYCHGEGENLDFDFDGQPGGDIQDFLIPEPPEDLGKYPNAATLTCFIGEGDEYWEGDYLKFNGTKLWDGINCDQNSPEAPNNVWNEQSVGVQYDGVDIDTFAITWESGLLEPGDTEAHLDMVSPLDHWNLVYIILSVRSETTTGGTTHYVIYN
jgi:Flp pilus assembly pilin Flp